MRRVLAAVMLALSVTVACSPVEDEVESPPVSRVTAPITTLHVLAASSLTEAFTDLGRAFEALNGTAKVTFTFASSTALVQQVLDGAPGDVLATADPRTMQTVIDAGQAIEPRVVAHNELAILVARGNPEKIRALPDLGQPGLIVALCAPEVPCGRYTASALRKAGAEVKPSSVEENVKGVVAKVILGEVDAGVVYATDVKAAAGRADGVRIDIAKNPDLQASYLMAPVAYSQHLSLAGRWAAFVLSFAGQTILADRGFLPA